MVQPEIGDVTWPSRSVVWELQESKFLSAGQRVADGLVSGIDMMPTCLDLAGIAPVDSVDGESIAPFLRGESDDTCETIFSERQEWCMIVSGDWKLVAQREAQGLEPSMMINLAEDPYELQNRVEDEALAERRAAMLERLVTWDRDVRNLLK